MAQNKKSWLSILDGSPHKSDLAINSLAALLLVLVPVIIFEKYTFYLYLTNPQNFFLYSGRRLWFDIIWFAASGVGSAFIIGRKRWIALLIPILGSLAFIVSAYSVPFCDPRECYVSSTDGLGALRDFILFASLGRSYSNTLNISNTYTRNLWMSHVVTVTKKGQATIPKVMREKHKIGRKVLVIDTSQGVLLKPLPDPSMERGSLKREFKGKSSSEIMTKVRREESKLELRISKKRN